MNYLQFVQVLGNYIHTVKHPFVWENCAFRLVIGVSLLGIDLCSMPFIGVIPQQITRCLSVDADNAQVYGRQRAVPSALTVADLYLGSQAKVLI